MWKTLVDDESGSVKGEIHFSKTVKKEVTNYFTASVKALNLKRFPLSVAVLYTIWTHEWRKIALWQRPNGSHTTSHTV